jgi:hypothetical protein
MARWNLGDAEEDRLVVAPAASLRPPAERKGPLARRFMARLKPCPFDGRGWDRRWLAGQLCSAFVEDRAGCLGRGLCVRGGLSSDAGIGFTVGRGVWIVLGLLAEVGADRVVVDVAAVGEEVVAVAHAAVGEAALPGGGL